MPQQSIYSKKMQPNLIFAKTRLAPVKKMTIPRLELMPVLIGVRCLKFVKTQLMIEISHEYFWTDSQIALDWINSKKQLPVFVKNRVKEIKSNNCVILLM
jgi:diketogulonate reductase-like aldo/keto reductase